MKRLTLQRAGNKGFSLLELLIAIIILSILVGMVVFTYVRKAEEARITNAQMDVDRMVEAESQVCVNTGFYCQLFLLDDPATTNTTTIWTPDGLALNQVFVNSQTNQMVTDAERAWERVRPLMSNPNRWRGPYLEFKERVTWTFDASNMHGTPIDPWGNPYELFTSAGWVSPVSGSVVPGYAPYWTVDPAANLNFDRNTILSVGPDGVIGSTDDIKRQF